MLQGDEAKPTTRRLNRVEREATLLDAAAGIVAEDGVEALTMEGIAARAGVNKALVYRFFTNRDDVLVGLWVRETARFDEAIMAALRGKRDFAQKLHAIVEAWLDEVEAGGCLIRLDAPGAGPSRLAERRKRREEAVVRFLADLIRSTGNISERDAFVMAAALGKGAQGLHALQAHTGWPRRPLVDTFVRLCVGAVESLAR